MAAMLLLIGFQGVLDGCYVIAQELLVFWVISYVLGNCESGCLAVLSYCLGILSSLVFWVILRVFWMVAMLFLRVC